ncbi:peptide MFS transporter [Luteibaculum oceani]|uniref:Peptide MFS transporter n=1 Tax=Luteibaculum oceani TaxID=1294296 RepID=A0A5C6V9P1_9FLAO|nr:peptide MFS transporter [Luteibaculum oceani]TXC81454.1 peptide MFS transporter [Luteibaculum oceani]
MSNITTNNSGELFGHPKGLFILFFTELWERFSYYGMRAILVLFIYSSISDGGMGWTKEEALGLYGWYTMLVYLMSIPGGLLADRLVGQKKAVMIGGVLLCAGHLVLAVPGQAAFFAGLTLIVLGVGALKPNISTMVGGLYKKGDIRRDKGFTIFYIGINIGAFLSSISVAYVAELYGWHYGFGLAGIGMIVGQIVYVWGQKFLKGVGDFIPKKSESGEDNRKALTKVEKDRMLVLFLSFIIIIVFWGAFEQAGGLMNIYTNEKIDRTIFGTEIPAGVFQSVNSFFIMTFGTLVAAYWAKRRIKGLEESSLFKMAIGTIIMGTGFIMMTAAAVDADASTDGKGALIWLILAYFLHTIGELCASPVALSFITKLAPVKYASFMMGAYFAATGLGNKVAGLLGEYSASWGELETFTGIAIFAILFGVVLILALKPLKRLTHGAEDGEAEVA